MSWRQMSRPRQKGLHQPERNERGDPSACRARGHSADYDPLAKDLELPKGLLAMPRRPSSAFALISFSLAPLRTDRACPTPPFSGSENARPWRRRRDSRDARNSSSHSDRSTPLLSTVRRARLNALRAACFAVARGSGCERFTGLRWRRYRGRSKPLPLVAWHCLACEAAQPFVES